MWLTETLIVQIKLVKRSRALSASEQPVTTKNMRNGWWSKAEPGTSNWKITHFSQIKYAPSWINFWRALVGYGATGKLSALPITMSLISRMAIGTTWRFLFKRVVQFIVSSIMREKVGASNSQAGNVSYPRVSTAFSENAFRNKQSKDVFKKDKRMMPLKIELRLRKTAQKALQNKLLKNGNWYWSKKGSCAAYWRYARKAAEL